jgi:hypothetical protein
LKRCKIGQPEFDERGDGVLKASFSREIERALVTLPGARRVSAVLQVIIASHQRLANAGERIGIHCHTVRSGLALPETAFSEAA